MSMVAAAAATAACPARFWGHSEGVPKGVAPSPPRHFTFEPLPATPGPSRPRRRHRRVLYPPAVRRPLPSGESNFAKRLLVLLLAVVGAQILAAPGDDADFGTILGIPSIPEGTQIPAGNSGVTPNSAIPEGPQIPAGNSGVTPNSTLGDDADFGTRTILGIPSIPEGPQIPAGNSGATPNSAPGDDADFGTRTILGIPSIPEGPEIPAGNSSGIPNSTIPEGPQIPAGNSGGIPNSTAAPLGGSCPSLGAWPLLMTSQEVRTGTSLFFSD